MSITVLRRLARPANVANAAPNLFPAPSIRLVAVFRYFGTKEDIVLGSLASQGEMVRQALEAVSATVGPWEALRVALDAVEALDVDPESTLKIARMMYATPSLRARSIEKHLHWQSLLVPNIRTRLGSRSDSSSDPAADAIVAAAIACLDVAGELWMRSEGKEDLGRLYDRAIAAIRS